MNKKTLAFGLTALVLVLGLQAILTTPSAGLAEPAGRLADTPTAEPPTPTATWSGQFFLPFGARGETPTPTATITPTATVTPTPPPCVFPDPTTPGITVEQGEWLLVNDHWVVHTPGANSRIVVRFTAVQRLSLWSVDNERQQANADPAEAHLDSGVQIILPWTTDLEIVPVPGGPWATQTITILAASGDSPGIRWCQWP